jgi:hypothetical protein
MSNSRKPAPRTRSRVSESVRAAERDSQNYVSIRTISQPGEWACYDGLLYLGRVVPVRGKYQARDADDHLIATVATSKAATSAVYEGPRS